MILDKLGSSLKDTLSKITRTMFLDEKAINEIVKEIQRALLSADVNVHLVFNLSKTIKERAIKEKQQKGITQKEHLITIIYEELVKLMGEEAQGIEINKKPFYIMLTGLFGSGKTTSMGKLAKFYTKKGLKVAVLGLDVHRPAAMDQLEQIAKQVNIPSFTMKKEKSPLKIYKEAKKNLDKFDLVLVDTSGRDALSEDLIKELEQLNKEIQPQERLLVISADIGQAAQKQAEAFHKAVNITGIVVTKLDGTAKGGGAITACSVSKAPIKFIGIGEKADDLEVFDPKRFVSRILGMGDLETLLEKAREIVTEEDAEEMKEKLLKGRFTLQDLYDQMQAMRKMGPLNKLIDLIPGLGNTGIPKEMLEGQEEKLDTWKYIMDSMTKKEKQDPDILTRSRIERIAKGSGTSEQEVRELLKQYKQSKKMMKLMKGMEKEQDMNKLMKKFKGKILRKS